MNTPQEVVAATGSGNVVGLEVPVGNGRGNRVHPRGPAAAPVPEVNADPDAATAADVEVRVKRPKRLHPDRRGVNHVTSDVDPVPRGLVAVRVAAVDLDRAPRPVVGVVAVAVRVLDLVAGHSILSALGRVHAADLVLAQTHAVGAALEVDPVRVQGLDRCNLALCSWGTCRGRLSAKIWSIRLGITIGSRCLWTEWI